MARIGSSNLDVFPMCFGGNVLGWTADSDTSHAILDAFCAGGGNFIDTADAYSQWVPGNEGGVSESVLGDWMAKRGNRAQLVIATKVGSKRDRAGLSPANIRAACDESLARLKTDYIDILLLHCMLDKDWNTKKRGAMDVIEEAQAKGIVRTKGVSCHTLEALKTAAAEPWVEVDLARLNPAQAAMDSDPNTVIGVLKEMKAATKKKASTSITSTRCLKKPPKRG